MLLLGMAHAILYKSTKLRHKKSSEKRATYYNIFFGGEAGIRTLGPVTDASLAVRYFRPLSHLSFLIQSNVNTSLLSKTFYLLNFVFVLPNKSEICQGTLSLFSDRK
jgi:hypothetical protein